MNKKIINLGLVIDRSGSVENEKYILNKSIELLIESISRKYSKIINFDIVIGIYGGEDDLILPLIKEENIIIKKEENKNIFESIFSISKVLLSKEGEKIIILFSDGYYRDENWREIFLKIQEENLKHIKRVAVGIGEGFYEESLELFSSNKEVFKCEDIYELL